MEDGPEALGVVVESDRGSLPFALLHGESLVACATWAMGEAGVQLVDGTTAWEDVVYADLPLVWHDALCPMTPPDFIAACVRRAADQNVVVAAVHPVTDTVKEVTSGPDGPVVGATHDRDALRRLVSPLVLPASVVARLGDWPATDLRVALDHLRALAEVVLVDAPDTARRVSGPADVARLEALTRR